MDKMDKERKGKQVEPQPSPAADLLKDPLLRDAPVVEGFKVLDFDAIPGALRPRRNRAARRASAG